MFSVKQFLCLAVLKTFVGAAPPLPNSPVCPLDFVAKYKNATIFCEQDGAEALISVTQKTRLVRAAPANASAIITSNLNSSTSTTPTSKDVPSSEEEEADPEIMLCSFGKLKQEIPQLEILERSCHTPINSTSSSNSATTTTSKSTDNLDEDLQMASCLEEKLEAMCPELSSVA
ncbi:hypothetical protein CHUAL_009528 [Chamberlinius hualienensis]